jgi:hypothetical protein
MFFHALLILCLGWVYPRSLLIGTDYNIHHFSFFASGSRTAPNSRIGSCSWFFDQTSTFLQQLVFISLRLLLCVFCMHIKHRHMRNCSCKINSFRALFLKTHREGFIRIFCPLCKFFFTLSRKFF